MIDKIVGTIKNAKSPTAIIQIAPKMSATLGGITIVAGEGKPYDGDYVVNPTFKKQTLPTKDTVLMDDITINSISINKTVNASGGNTIVIGD